MPAFLSYLVAEGLPQRWSSAEWIASAPMPDRRCFNAKEADKHPDERSNADTEAAPFVRPERRSSPPPLGYLSQQHVTPPGLGHPTWPEAMLRTTQTCGSEPKRTAQACGLKVQQHAEHHSFDMLRLQLG